ncbi:MAG: hypothetical protein JWR69_3076 [Pedosphaera sp.]|nr:hypothetical protein [Pedosphaera sp.]
MKKPTKGDELTIKYNGSTLKAICFEVTDVPKRGPDAAKFAIISKERFKNGGQAFFVNGSEEVGITVESVTSMPDKRADRVSFYGLFVGN